MYVIIIIVNKVIITDIQENFFSLEASEKHTQVHIRSQEPHQSHHNLDLGGVTEIDNFLSIFKLCGIEFW